MKIIKLDVPTKNGNQTINICDVVNYEPHDHGVWIVLKGSFGDGSAAGFTATCPFEWFDAKYGELAGSCDERSG